MSDSKICSFRDRLSQLLEIKGLSQIEFCNIVGLDKSTVSLYMHNKRSPRQFVIARISDAFNINPAWLMGYDAPMERTYLEKAVAELSSDVEIKKRTMLNNLVQIAANLSMRDIDTLILLTKSMEVTKNTNYGDEN